MAGAEVQPVVSPGDTVQAGQIIGRDDNTVSAPIHASISGTVAGIESHDINGEKIKVVRIEAGEGSSDADLLPAAGAVQEWESLPTAKIEDLLYLTGTAGLDIAGIPTRFNSSPVKPAEVSEIIVAHSESDLFQPSLLVLLAGERLESFSQGIRILRKLFEKIPIHIVLNGERKSLLKDIGKKLDGISSVEIVAAPPKYPQDAEQILMQSVLGEKCPAGKPAILSGVLILSVPTILSVCRSVMEGTPAVKRTIALGGEGFTENVHVEVPVGAAVEEVVRGRLRQGENRVVMNSLNTGVKIEDLSSPVLWHTTSLIALPEVVEEGLMPFAMPGFFKDSFSITFPSRFMPVKKKLNTNIHGEERACLQCGYCIEACPVGIYPNLLHRYAERNIIEDSLVTFGIFECIDCNLCTYVCTSKLPLAENIREGKAKLREEGFDS
jgi:Na(+)-translocating NADH:ubiquinone oxidoreductase A subunit